MKERAKTLQQYIVLVLLFPICFLAHQAVVTAILLGLSADDAVYRWLDGWFSLPPSGSSQWVSDILTLLPTVWSTWFLLGAAEEIRYTPKACPITQMEIVSRWLALATLGQMLPSASGLLFFFLLSLVLWPPLAIVLALALAVLLYYFTLKYPIKRVRYVERVYYFEKVKGQ